MESWRTNSNVSSLLWETGMLRLNNSNNHSFAKAAGCFAEEVCNPPPKEGEEKEAFWMPGGETSYLHKSSPGAEGVRTHHQMITTTNQHLFSNKLAFEPDKGKGNWLRWKTSFAGELSRHSRIDLKVFIPSDKARLATLCWETLENVINVINYQRETLNFMLWGLSSSSTDQDHNYHFEQLSQTSFY